MTRFVLAALLVLSAAPALAQQRPATPAELQGVIAALSAQVDATRNLHIQAEAKAAGLAEEVARLKAQIDEMGKRAEPPK